jgi:hypothetical protein
MWVKLLDGSDFRVNPPVMCHALEIVVPALDRYSYTLLTVRHGIDPYPLIGDFADASLTLNSEDQLLDWLREVFASATTRKLISSFLAQVKR